MALSAGTPSCDATELSAPSEPLMDCGSEAMKAACATKKRGRGIARMVARTPKTNGTAITSRSRRRIAATDAAIVPGGAKVVFGADVGRGGGVRRSGPLGAVRPGALIGE